MNGSVIREVEVEFDGSIEMIRAEKISDNVYCCLESLVFIDLELYGCEIEVEEKKGKLKFVKIRKESNFQTHIYIWSKEFLASEAARKIKQKIRQAGGEWEQVMGGVFFIHLPKEKDNMLEEILKIDE